MVSLVSAISKKNLLDAMKENDNRILKHVKEAREAIKKKNVPTEALKIEELRERLSFQTQKLEEYGKTLFELGLKEMALNKKLSQRKLKSTESAPLLPSREEATPSTSYKRQAIEAQPKPAKRTKGS